MSRQSASFFSAASRLQTTAVWDALEFLLNGLIFILLGLQLPYVVSGLREYSRMQLVGYGFAFSASLIALRLIWVYPGSMVASALRRLVTKERREPPPAKGVFVTCWTGMRGVVALAAASSLPYTLANGAEFPQRNLILFLTFSVILVTLVLQGMSLPYLVRLLGFPKQDVAGCEEGEARRMLLHAAIATLQVGRKANPAADHTYEDLLHSYEHRIEEISECGPEVPVGDLESHSRSGILRDAVRAEREELTKLRNDGRIGDGLHRTLERELDLSESRLSMTR